MKARKMLLAAAVGLVLASVTAQITMASQGAKVRRPAKPSGGSAVAGARIERPAARGDGWTTHAFDLFTIRTPASWSARGPVGAGYDAAHGSYILEDGRGVYFAVNVDPEGSDFGADSVWRYRMAGGAIVLDATADCAPGGGDPFCSAGDGRLDIYAIWAEGGSADLKGHRYYFAFGDRTSEAGADRAVFERILESIRIR